MSYMNLFIYDSMWDMIHHFIVLCQTWLIIFAVAGASQIWLIPLCDMTHSYTRVDSFTRETWLTLSPRCAFAAHRFIILYETWLISTWDMTHSHVRHDSSLMHKPVLCFCCLSLHYCDRTWLIYMWNMTHPYLFAHSYVRPAFIYK